MFKTIRHAGQAESTIQSMHFSIKHNVDLINKLDNKVETLEDLIEPADYQRQISEGLIRARQFLQQDIDRNHATILPAVREVMKDLEHRFNSFEFWFRDKITPELMQIKSDLQQESMTREAADEDLVKVLGRYARILHRHFGPSEVDEPIT